MNVLGKSYMNIKKFKDLKYGDVFIFVSKISNNFSENQIYLRCGHTSIDKTAVNIETGIMYGFDLEEPVILLDGTYKIKENK